MIVHKASAMSDLLSVTFILESHFWILSLTVGIAYVYYFKNIFTTLTVCINKSVKNELMGVLFFRV